MFGGNSNWRGPLWFPLNDLVVSALERHHRFFGDDFQAEYPTGSGAMRSLDKVADDLRQRLVALFLVGPDGRRLCFGGVERLQSDPVWKDNLVFNEYFHGDNGAGLGAMHQTGWTGVVADLIRGRPGDGVFSVGEAFWVKESGQCGRARRGLARRPGRCDPGEPVAPAPSTTIASPVWSTRSGQRRDR